jgi:hypothetical protein
LRASCSRVGILKGVVEDTRSGDEEKASRWGGRLRRDKGILAERDFVQTRHKIEGGRAGR